MLRYTSIGLPAMDDFNFCDLEMTLKSHPRSRSLRILNPCAMFLLVFISNYWSISHSLGAMDVQSFRYRHTTACTIGSRRGALGLDAI